MMLWMFAVPKHKKCIYDESVAYSTATSTVYSEACVPESGSISRRRFKMFLMLLLLPHVAICITGIVILFQWLNAVIIHQANDAKYVLLFTVLQAITAIVMHYRAIVSTKNTNYCYLELCCSLLFLFSFTQPFTSAILLTITNITVAIAYFALALAEFAAGFGILLLCRNICECKCHQGIPTSEITYNDPTTKKPKTVGILFKTEITGKRLREIFGYIPDGPLFICNQNGKPIKKLSRYTYKTFYSGKYMLKSEQDVKSLDVLKLSSI